MTSWWIIVWAGELLGHLYKACDPLKAVADVTPLEIKTFEAKAPCLANLANKLDPQNLLSETIPQASESTSSHVLTLEFIDPDTMETQHLGWGPKTSDPGLDQIYCSDQLQEIIDVDPQSNLEQQEALYKVIEQNQATFSFNSWLGHLKSEVHIKLVPGMKPISMPPYYASLAKREAIDKQINLWLMEGIIEESQSPWWAPVIVVYHNNKPRVCIDFRRLNKATIVDQHLIPKQMDILQALSGAQYLLIFDALSGFTQLEFNKQSRPITAVWTHHGLHHFKRMPFGWRNGPPEFQWAMQGILSLFLWIFTLVYINDIVVYSKSFEDHLKHIDFVLKAIAQSSLTLSPPKCHLGYCSIVVLGHIVSWLGLSTHHEKLKVIWELKAPTDHKKLETFLGLAVYFSWMANLLFKNLRQKDSTYTWMDTDQKCFELIKLALVSAPVRGHPKPGQTYHLYTDASDYAITGTLQQIQFISIKDLQGTHIHKWLAEAYKKGDKVPDLVVRLSKEVDNRRPTPEWSKNREDTKVPVKRVVAYWSWVLAPAKTRYSAMEWEALAAKKKPCTFPTLHRRGEDTTGHGPLGVNLGKNVWKHKLKISCMGTRLHCLPWNGHYPQARMDTF